MKALRQKLTHLKTHFMQMTLLATAPIIVDKHGAEKRIATIPPHPIPSEIEALEKKGVTGGMIDKQLW